MDIFENHPLTNITYLPKYSYCTSCNKIILINIIKKNNRKLLNIILLQNIALHTDNSTRDVVPYNIKGFQAIPLVKLKLFVYKHYFTSLRKVTVFPTKLLKEKYFNYLSLVK